VKMDRAIGRGFEPAVANMPIVEKSRLRNGRKASLRSSLKTTAPSGWLPIRWSNSSNWSGWRQGPRPRRFILLRGMAYVSLVKTRGNAFQLLFGQQILALEPGSHIRLDLNEAQANLAVLDGTVRVDGPAGPEEIARKKTVTFHLARSKPAHHRKRDCLCTL